MNQPKQADNSFDFLIAQWRQGALSTARHTATTFIIENRQFYHTQNNNNGDDYIEFVLPHKEFYKMFNLSRNF